jgi:hypothetical protein
MWRRVSMMGMGAVKGWMTQGKLVGGLVGDGVRVLGILDMSRPLVPRVVMVVIVDGIGSAPFGWIVMARETDRRVLVPACHRQLHRTCSV